MAAPGPKEQPDTAGYETLQRELLTNRKQPAQWLGNEPPRTQRVRRRTFILVLVFALGVIVALAALTFRMPSGSNACIDRNTGAVTESSSASCR